VSDDVLALHAAARRLSEQGRYHEALPVALEARDKARELWGEVSESYAASLTTVAAVYHGMGDYVAAKPFWEQALDVLRRVEGDVRRAVAEVLNGLAVLYGEMGLLEQVEPLLQESLALARAIEGEESLSYANALNSLGVYYRLTARYADAQSAYDAALGTVRDHHGAEDPLAATILMNLGVLHSTTGDAAQAKRFLAEALDLRRRHLDPAHPGIATVARQLADAQRQAGELRQAMALLTTSLEDARASLGDRHPRIADFLHSMSNLQRATGDYAAAQRAATQALEIDRAALGDRHWKIAADLQELGLLYLDVGELEQAEALLQQARAMCVDVHRGGHPQLAGCLNDLGELYRRRGWYRQADQCHRQALELRRSLLGEQHPDVSQSLHNIALLLHDLGDHQQALRLQGAAVERLVAAYGTRHPTVATALDNLAALHQDLRRYDEAERLFEQVLRIRRATLGGRHRDVAVTLNNLGALSRVRGDLARADRLYREAGNVWREAVGEQHPDYSFALNNRGEVLYGLGRLRQADTVLRAALEVRRNALGDGHPATARTQFTLAAVEVACGEPEAALLRMTEAASSADNTVGQVFSIGSERQRATFLRVLRWETDVLLSLAVQAPHTPAARRSAFELVLRRKALAAEALSILRDALTSRRHLQLAGQLSRLRVLRSQAGKKILAGPGPEGATAHRRMLAEWEAERERIESELARQLPELALVERWRNSDVGVIAAALPAHAALIEFVQFNEFDFLRNRRGAPRYLAFVLLAGSDEEVELIDLGGAAPIDDLVARYRTCTTGRSPSRPTPARATSTGARQAAPSHIRARLLGQLESVSRDFVQPNDEKDTDAIAGCDDVGVDLRAAVFDPIVDALRGRKRLILAPDGELTQLPYETLPVVGDRYLIDDYAISYVTVGRDAALFLPSAPLPTSGPVVVADPDFDLDAPSTASGSPFRRLNGTRTEGTQIAAMLGVTPVTEDRALEQHMKSVKAPRILHIATHGFFVDGGAAEEQLPPEVPSDAAASWHDRISQAENPLLRSGLALAGANTWLAGHEGLLPPEAEDGLLTAEDVTGLDLVGTELVVLSACDTGLGEIQAGEGVFGLRRAFVLAGAQTLVMSLWKVPDADTTELMERFYSNLVDRRMDTAEALRCAQLEMRRRNASVFRWGAFVCQGHSRILWATDQGITREAT
jgi:CHAT domain-containing protein/tetratricopeptide (TPR) repeat protein